MRHKRGRRSAAPFPAAAPVSDMRTSGVSGFIHFAYRPAKSRANGILYYIAEGKALLRNAAILAHLHTNTNQTQRVQRRVWFQDKAQILLS